MIRKFANTDLDLSAAGIATACIIHCLVPPLVAAFAPALASWAEVEWIHKALALTATPISLFAISRRWGMQGAPIFVSIVRALLEKRHPNYDSTHKTRYRIHRRLWAADI